MYKNKNVLIEYEQVTYEKGRRRVRIKQITTSQGIARYCSHRKIPLVPFLVEELKFKTMWSDEVITTHKCLLCGEILPLYKRGVSIDVNNKIVRLQTCACLKQNKLSINKNRFRTIFDSSKIDVIYDNFNTNKMRNWTTKGIDVSSLNAYIKRHGFMKGTKLYSDGLISHATATKKYYMDRGFSEKDAEIELKKRQSTFSLDKCIAKFGKKEGKSRWQRRQDKWQDTLTRKSQDEINIINKKKYGLGGYSKISQKLFDSFGFPDARYATNGGEYREKTENGKHISYDYKLDNKIIEFNGDYWHANPELYESGTRVTYNSKNQKILVDDIWERDKERTKEIKKLGYDIFIVWERDYINEPNETKQKCLEFLNAKLDS